MEESILNNFEAIKVETPTDKIINQIRNLIASGQLNPGDRLPSERQLSEKFKIGRTYVRDAIKKLEFYGVLKTQAQSGTFVAGLGLNALEGLIEGILEIEGNDFKSLIETRVILEIEAARLAAERRSDKNLEELEELINKFHDEVHKGNSAVETDFLFHLKIAEASQNSVIRSLLLLITPEIIELYKQNQVCNVKTAMDSYNQHKMILDSIKKQDKNEAALAMKNHFKHVLDKVKL